MVGARIAGAVRATETSLHWRAVSRMEMTTETYGYEKTIPDLSFDAAVSRVKLALSSQGFGVLTEIDVQATPSKKLNVEFRPYLILGACKPELAYRALSAEPSIGLLLPCNVVVQELQGGISVSIANPRAMFSLVRAPELEAVVEEADQRLRRVAAAL